jgi:hypothetical protein
MSYPEIITTNDSSSLGILVLNITNLEPITVFRHPILYGVAIYALLLIIIGTIGK